MTRTSRKKSVSGVYHVVARGVNRQNIFEYPEDREKYLEILHSVKEISGFKLYGYCLMDNHIHLLIGEGAESIAVVFKRLGARYVVWFNHKYERTGPLFQGRYHSEIIDDDTYLLSALRYIHQNPVKAGICAGPEGFRWSSYSDYPGKGQGITDTAFVLNLFSPDIAKQIRLFVEFMSVDGETHMDVDQNTPDANKEKMRELCGVESASAFQALESGERDKGVRELRKAGLSIRQIVRLTGVPFGIVRRLGR